MAGERKKTELPCATVPVLLGPGCPSPLRGIVRAAEGIGYPGIGCPHTLPAIASPAAGEGRGGSGEHLLAAQQSWGGAQRCSWGSASLGAG